MLARVILYAYAVLLALSLLLEQPIPLAIAPYWATSPSAPCSMRPRTSEPLGWSHRPPLAGPPGPFRRDGVRGAFHPRSCPLLAELV